MTSSEDPDRTDLVPPPYRTERVGPSEFAASDDLVDRVLAGLREADETRPAFELPERYEPLGVLGRGGMAVVYRARDRQLGREVALKRLRDDLRLDPEASARFRREAEAAARLAHPGIVPVHDAGEGWLVMELVAGRSLAERLAAEPPSPAESAGLVEAIARAVEAAHRGGVVHRDLKPGNVLLGPEGPKVADFGLARVAGDTRLTATGDVFGTPVYMAPEQARGDRGRIGPATDVYALGAILYECLTGVPPYGGGSPVEILRRVNEEDPVPVLRRAPGVPPALATIAHKAMEREPGRRYPSAAAMADDLARWRAGAPIAARPASWAYRLRRRFARRRVAVVAALAGLAVAGVALVPSIVEARRTAERAGVEARRTAKRAELSQALWRDVSVFLAESAALSRAGEVEEARALRDRGIERCRSSATPEASYFLGRLLAAGGDDVKALVELDRAIALDPDLGEAHFERGLLLVRNYLRRLLPRYYAHYAGLPPGSDAPGPRGAELEAADPPLAELARRAEEDLAAPLGKSPYYDELDARFGRAELDRLRWDFEAATEAYEAILSASPRQARAQLALGEIALLFRRYAEAARRGSLAIEIDQGSGAARLLRGRARTWMGDPEAGPDLEAALALLVDPFDRELAFLERGHLRRRRDPEGALADFAQTLETSPDNAVAWAGRGATLANLGRDEEALAALDRALELSPRYARARFNRAMIRADRNDLAGAGDDLDGAEQDAHDPALAEEVRVFRQILLGR